MCSRHLVLALVVLYVGMAHSWDIAISVGDRLEFYTNNTKTNTVHFKSRNVTAITYNEVHNVMLFVDKQSDNDAICGYNIGSMDTRCFIKRNGSNIQDLAFDPVTELLFFTDTKEGSINSISLKNNKSEDNVYGNLLIKVNDPPVKSIAVDSCRGYIYWTNAHEHAGQNIMERARFDGSQREVVYKFMPVRSFAIDPKTNKYYFIDGVTLNFYRKADLREKNLHAEKTDFFCTRCVFQSLPAPNELTVSKNYIYWMTSSVNHTIVWRTRKNADISELPRNVISFYRERPVGIATNYRVGEQVEGRQDCEALSHLVPTIAATHNFPNIRQNKRITEANQTVEVEQTTEVELICVYGIKVRETSVCKCTPGYTGERCEVSVCENYCLQGNCSFNDEGLPSCRCNGGYSGERCEVNACHGYCLHDGGCSLNEKSNPVCQCEGSYNGDRCEVSGCLNYCVQGSCSFNDEGLPVCRCNAGYFGERCEVNACHGYCLNHGECTLNEEDQPVCECVSNHEGSRCETVKHEALTNSLQYSSTKQNLTLTDLLSNWKKLTANISVTVEVKSN